MKMRVHRRTASLFCLGVILGWVLQGSAQPAAEVPASLRFDAETDEASLFDGQALGAWQKTDFFGQGEVSIQDRSIVLQRGHDMTGITWTGPLLTMNYEIRLEAKRLEGTDFFCGLTFPVGEQYCSFICGGWGGGLVGISNVDYYDAANNQTSQSRSFDNDRWYTIQVRVTKKLLQAWIDGDLMVDLDTDEHHFSVRHEVDKSRPLGIATWQTAAALRKLSIRRCEPVDRYLSSYDYFPKKVKGWRVRASEILERQHPETLKATLSSLERQLEQIRTILPPGPLAKLQEIPIWLEREDRDLPVVCYHEDREWLRARGYNPDKAGSIEIARAAAFLEQSNDASNLMLGPLARAYHHQVLGDDHAGINKAYDAAVKRGNYEKVRQSDGSWKAHPALETARSYFAEGTEAFFGRNDSYPFVRSELEALDPELYRLLVEIWK